MRLLPTRNAINKVRELLAQGLDLFQLRGPHISGTIVHQQFVDALAAGDIYAPVVYLYLFVGFEIVPDQHSLLSAHESGPNLYWGEPVDIDMRYDLLWKIEG